MIRFARYIGRPLDPWQQWVVIHAGELLPDGRPRFRQVLVLVARQNGKTELLVVLTLYWLWVERVALVLGTSTKLEYAAESWRKACRLAKRHHRLRTEICPKRGIRRVNGEQELWRSNTIEREYEDGSRYKIAASNDEGGRALTIHRLVLDELRQHHDYSAWDASVPACNAVPDGQVWAITNAGSARSVVLHDMRDAALSFIETGEGDYRLGLMEYSCPPGSNPLDLRALAMANPNLGQRSGHAIDPEILLGDARTAMDKGGEKLTGFKIEYMCMFVPRLNPAVDPDAWGECRHDGDLAAVRDRVACCLDISPDLMHVTLAAAAALPGDEPRVRVETVKAWSGPHAVRDMRAELPALVRKVRPRAFGWFPDSPAAAAAAELADPKRKRQPGASWPPAGVTVEEIRRDVGAVCMGFAELVGARQIVHSGDKMLDAHVLVAEKLSKSNVWIFARPVSEDGAAVAYVDAAYAAAGAVHLARTLPPPPPRKKVISSRRRADDSGNRASDS